MGFSRDRRWSFVTKIEISSVDGVASATLRTSFQERWRIEVRIALSLGLAAVLLAASYAGADDKPKYTTKEVMKEAHGKPKLLNKVLDGKATDDDKKKLLELYEAMAKNKPAKGDADNWKKLNDAIVAAAKDVVAGKDGSVDALKKATKCGDCHSAHK